MKISARNVLAGKVKAIKTGSVNSGVTIELAGGAEIVSIITKSSVSRLGLKKGMAVQAVIKSSDVMVATD